MSIRNFVSLLFSTRKPGNATNESLESFLKTVDDATHVQGRGPNTAGNSHVYRHILQGHRNYTNSFKSRRRDS